MNRKCILAVYVVAITITASIAVIASETEPSMVLLKDSCPGITSSLMASAKLVKLPAGIVLRTGNISITQKDLDKEIAKAPETIQSQLKHNLLFLLENKITQNLIQTEAKDWAKISKRNPKETQGELIQAYFASLTKDSTVSDDEAKSFYDGNREMMGSTAFDQVKDQLKEYLLDQKRQNAININIAGLGERFRIEIEKDWALKQYAVAINNPVDKARQSGKPSLVDFGADGCQACDMMAPILGYLDKEYAGKANIVVINVRKEQILASRFGIQSIPVQVFFDKDGKEVFRHVGFFPKEQMAAKLAELGVK